MRLGHGPPPQGMSWLRAPSSGAQGPVVEPETGYVRPNVIACGTFCWTATKQMHHVSTSGQRLPSVAIHQSLLQRHVAQPNALPILQAQCALHKVQPSGYDLKTPRSSCGRHGSKDFGFPTAAAPHGLECVTRQIVRLIHFQPNDYRVYKCPHLLLLRSAHRHRVVRIVKRLLTS